MPICPPCICWAFLPSRRWPNDGFILGVGSFKLSPFDVIFVAILVVKAMRLADPAAYALPRALGLLHPGAVGGLSAAGVHRPSRHRDRRRGARPAHRVLFPDHALSLLDIDTPHAYAVLQKYIIAACLTVATLMLLQQLQGFSIANPVRNVRLGVWAIPLGVVSLLYFRRTLRISGPKAYALTLYMLLALVFSLNRSQYLQLAVSVLLAMMLASGSEVRRRVVLIFAPAAVAGVLVFASIGYLDVLTTIFASSGWTRTPATARACRKCKARWTSSRKARCSARARDSTLGHGREWLRAEHLRAQLLGLLMKFGLVGTIMIMLPPLLILLLTLFRRYAHPGLELHRRYLLATAPIYIFIDSMSGGLAYAPKTAFTVPAALSLLRNARAMPVPARDPADPGNRPDAPRRTLTRVLPHA